MLPCQNENANKLLNIIKFLSLFNIYIVYIVLTHSQKVKTLYSRIVTVTVKTD